MRSTNKNPEQAATKGGNAPLLYTLIAAKPASIGALLDYANAVPAELVTATAISLALSVINDYRRPHRRAARRRRLIILGALLTRLAFDIEGIPKDRSKII